MMLTPLNQQISSRQATPNKSRHPDHERFSIGPQILFILSTEKTEEYVANIRNKIESAKDNWALAQLLWIYLEEWANGEATEDLVKGYLSTAQYHSFIILQDWIHSKYELEAVAHPFARWLHDADVATLGHELLDEDDGVEARDSHIMHKGFRHASLYQKLLSDLFRKEFSPAHWVGERYRQKETHGINFHNHEFGDLDYCRHRAWQVCVSQRVAWKFTILDWNQGLENSTTSQVFENPLERKNYCPWLHKDKTREGFPRYLWDVAQKKTVDTSEFAHRVPYTCISHTWGRWRRKEWVDVVGVPWRVPLNSRFNIEELPVTFYSMKDRLTTDYIWLDLYCMPQETNDPQIAAILKEEIARQAAIFQNAASCIAWLNYINHWVAEYCAIGWLCAQYFEMSSGPGMQNSNTSLLQAAIHGSQLPLQLARLDKPTFGYSERRAMFVRWRNEYNKMSRKMKKRGPYYHFEPSDWFSGVWTLQEAYLRPNMVLADKNWTILSDPSGQPIALEELFALDYVVWQLVEWGTQVLGHFILEGQKIEHWPFDEVMGVYRRNIANDSYPPGPRQLHHMICKTHLFGEGPDSRLDPLIQANARFCTAGPTGRAEAIMSSLGVTKWFKTDPTVRARDLVMGMYPVHFLVEALISIGPDFYTTSVEYASIWAIFYPFTKKNGSMMPFHHARLTRHKMNSVKSRGSLPFHDPTALDPSVATWAIRIDGSVTIKRAVVLASSRPEHPSFQGHGLASLAFWGRDYSKSGNYRLSEWIEQQPRYLDSFVVSLTQRDAVETVGVLLQGRRIGKTTRLVKIGIFHLVAMEGNVGSWPDVKEVDWIVV